MQNTIKSKTTSTKAYIFFNRSNIEVTRNYLDVIQSALNSMGYDCEYIRSLRGVPKKSLIVYAVGVDAFLYYLKGYHNIVLWQQGAAGAESFMRHHSEIRKRILNYMDCFVMRKAKMIFFVSQYMQNYYETLARTSFAEKSYVMPCFNEVLDTGVFEKKDYSKKIFTYVGSLDLWQCFNETADIYAEIEKRIPNTFFKVLTFHTEKAEQILSEKNIKNYSVARVPKEQVKQELENATFGFIIRRDVDVNRVATPTKISSYLSAGVLPIYSSCLKDFHAQADGKAFAFALNPDEDLEKLTRYVNRNIDKDTVQKEIEDVFRTYYSTENHIKNIITLANACLK